ncbi:MAG: hypothetical protein SFY96_03230 [Planctomycetota bacterium]|nr:hypothetical protein [Planctomycetota bacterium]
MPGCQQGDVDKATDGSPRASEPQKPAAAPQGKKDNGKPASSPTATQEEAKRVFASPGKTIAPAAAAAPEAADAPNAGKWVIVLATINAEGEDAANQALTFARSSVGFSDAYVTRRGSVRVVALGAFDSYEDANATKELLRVRGASVGDVRPFAGAFLSPPLMRGEPGNIPDLDLRNARKIFGNDAKYTLQVCVYCRPDRVTPSKEELAEFRKAAEAAALELRRGGELAFYYHGPERSTVTIGLFNNNDLQGPDGEESEDIREARRKHPYYLVNGMGQRQVVRDAEGKKKNTDLKKSVLVEVPKQ